MTDKETIRENADYVLGMYELYGQDEEIVDLLKLKGIEARLIPAILNQVKLPAYLKRIRQAKKMIWIGSVLIFIFFVIPFSLIYLFNVDFSGNNSLLNGTRSGEGMLRGVFRLYSKFYIYIGLIGLVQLSTGIFNLFKYRKLARETEPDFS
ncbi:MAG: hypothetical protein IPI66_07680 [Chitinophagaceae bacterium]|nr:hypothetical protein [Chitinophagaceae bacterium]